MGNLLFSPSGRINSAQFIKGAMILIGIMFLIKITPLISSQLSSILSIVGLVFIWCWIVLWVKRYHDAGKSGWLSIIPILLWGILGYFVSQMVTNAVVPTETMSAFKDAVAEATEAGNFTEMFSVMQGAEALEISRIATLPTAIAGAIWSAIIAFAFNAMIKHQPEENQFGHPS